MFEKILTGANDYNKKRDELFPTAHAPKLKSICDIRLRGYKASNEKSGSFRYKVYLVHIVILKIM